MNQALLGAIAALSLVAALFFVRYWLSTRDRFFVLFALSFLVESANRIHMAMTQAWNEDSPVHFTVRVVAYLLILIAILDKNWPRR